MASNCQLRTARLKLELINESDLDKLFILRSNSNLSDYEGTLSDKSIEDTKKFLKRVSKLQKAKEAYYYTLTLEAEDELIGIINLWNFGKFSFSGEVGFFIDPNYQGMGLASEALEFITNYSFNILGLYILYAHISASNLNAVKLLERNNFIYIKDYQEKNKATNKQEKILVYKITKD